MATRKRPAPRTPSQPQVCFHAIGSKLLPGLVEAAKEFGWRIIDSSITYGTVLGGTRVDGIISSANMKANDICGLAPTNPPTVLLMFGDGSGQESLSPEPGAVVLLDLKAQGRVAADHFIERGFKHVAYVGHHPWSMMKSMYVAFHDTSIEHGVSCDLLQFVSDRQGEETDAERWDRRSGELVSWVRSLPRPLGLLTYENSMAARIAFSLSQAGLMIPEEVAILGRGDDAYRCESAVVPLSSVSDNCEIGAREAALQLRRLMQGTPPRRMAIHIPPSGVVVRQSTDVLAIDNPNVSQAIRFMWNNLGSDLAVDEIAQHAGIQRRSLERAFRHHLGRGINEELLRKRLETFGRLLVSTDTSIADLAVQVGFFNVTHLRRCFRRKHGMSPRQFRARLPEQDLSTALQTLGTDHP